MLSRLLKLPRRRYEPAFGLGTAHLLALLAACGGKEFTANGGASAGSAAGGSAGDTSQAGESSSAEGGSSGAPGGGRGGAAGSAGKAATGCDCSPGEYCQDGTGKCPKCADFSRLQFAAAQKLTALAQSPQSIERFPRYAGTGSALFYVSGAPDAARILYAAAPSSGVGIPISTAARVESGPLLAPGFKEQNLFFDRQQTGHRKLMMAVWADSALSKEALVPEPINAAGFDDYSVAISPNTGHVYWMSTRNGQAELLWQPTSMSAPPPPAVLPLRVKAGKGDCARGGEDATPWVSAEGTLLLFRNPSVNESCEPNDSGATDLFAVPLASDGTPQVAATPLASLNITGGMSSESDASLSPDFCTLYFASDSGTGDFDLYRAQRN